MEEYERQVGGRNEIVSRVRPGFFSLSFFPSLLQEDEEEDDEEVRGQLTTLQPVSSSARQCVDRIILSPFFHPGR